MADRALEFAEKAIDLDPTLPVAHGTMGNLYLWRMEHDRAIAEQEKWIELDPNNADAYLQLATALAFAGEPEKALPLLNESMRLNPNYSFLTMFVLGHVNYQLGKLEEAVILFEQSLSRNPNFFGSSVYLVAAYAELGEEEKAREGVAKLKHAGIDSVLRHSGELLPYKYVDEKKRLVDALGEAGLDI